jgi:hypothetical protein
MKIINSPVRNVSPDIESSNDPRSRGWASKPKAIAAAKKIARKRERAMLRPLATKELLQEHLVTIAEQRAAARFEREYAYYDLMRKLTRPSRKHTSRAKQHKPAYCVDLPIGETRLEFRIEYVVAGERCESALLASCAFDN